ncbi:MAG: hypothetical protein IJW50_09055, partial [Clostridia bacterium]|nr:hypothetical protein [Clostridia bacterium]
MRATLGVWALLYAFVIQRRNWRKTEIDFCGGIMDKNILTPLGKIVVYVNDTPSVYDFSPYDC